MRLTRYPDWPEQLARFMHARAQEPFDWSAQHCCSFAADAVLATTGVDLMANLRHLNTAAACMRYLRAHGLPGLVSERLGEMRPASHAQRGDVVLLRQQGRELLGVCVGAIWAAPGSEGLLYGPMVDAAGCWAVGRDE